MNDPTNNKPTPEKAIGAFNSEMNCAQSVFSAYADFLKIDTEQALSVSCGFGAGMGRLQGTCGAVTGACMVLSLVSAAKFKDNADRKEHAKTMIQEFHQRFIAKHKTTDCRALLNCDLNTDEGQQFMTLNNLSETVCEVCIADAVQIINGIVD